MYSYVYFLPNLVVLQVVKHPLLPLASLTVHSALPGLHGVPHGPQDGLLGLPLQLIPPCLCDGN